MAKLTNAERETVIRRSADERYWDCYSCVPADVRRLRRIAASWDVAVTEIPYEGVRVHIPVTSSQSLGPRKKVASRGNPEALKSYRDSAQIYRMNEELN